MPGSAEEWGFGYRTLGRLTFKSSRPPPIHLAVYRVARALCLGLHVASCLQILAMYSLILLLLIFLFLGLIAISEFARHHVTFFENVAGEKQLVT